MKSSASETQQETQRQKATWKLTNKNTEQHLDLLSLCREEPDSRDYASHEQVIHISHYCGERLAGSWHGCDWLEGWTWAFQAANAFKTAVMAPFAVDHEGFTFYGKKRWFNLISLLPGRDRWSTRVGSCAVFTQHYYNTMGQTGTSPDPFDFQSEQKYSEIPVPVSERLQKLPHYSWRRQVCNKGPLWLLFFLTSQPWRRSNTGPEENRTSLQGKQGGELRSLQWHTAAWRLLDHLLRWYRQTDRQTDLVTKLITREEKQRRDIKHKLTLTWQRERGAQGGKCASKEGDQQRDTWEENRPSKQNKNWNEQGTEHRGNNN